MARTSFSRETTITSDDWWPTCWPIQPDPVVALEATNQPEAVDQLEPVSHRQPEGAGAQEARPGLEAPRSQPPPGLVEHLGAGIHQRDGREERRDVDGEPRRAPSGVWKRRATSRGLVSPRSLPETKVSRNADFQRDTPLTYDFVGQAQGESNTGSGSRLAKLVSCLMAGLLIIYAIVAIGMVVSLRKPVWGLLIYVGLSVLRPDALWGWAGNLHSMSRLTAMPLLIGWAFQGFGSWKFGPARPIVICLFLFTFWAIISSTQALVNSEVAWMTLVEFSKTLLPFLVGLTMLKTEKEVRQLLWVIVLCQAYVALDMNRMYLDGYNRAGLEGYGGLDNNSFGISLVTTIGASLGLMLSAKDGRSRAVAGAATLLILHTILLTFSRGAFVGLIAVGVVAIIIFPKRPTYIGAIVLAVLIGFRFTGPELSERLGSTFEPREMRDASAQSRFDLWRDCMVIIGEHPLLGVGLENWPLVAPRFGWPDGKEAHSLWVQTAAEVGIPGVTFLVLFYLITIKKLWPIARGRAPGIDRSTAMFATGIVLSIVGFGVSSQFVSLRGLEPPFYLAMIGAVLIKILANEAAEAIPARAKPGSLAPRVAVVPVGTRTTIVRPS